MITARFENDELVTEGTVEEGDIYPGLCCPGYDFTITTIIISAWGHCDSPDHKCSDHDEAETCPYCGVNVFETEDIALFIAEKHAQPTD